MPGMVSMKQSVFVCAVVTARTAATRVDAALDTWSTMGEKSAVIDAYADEYLNLENILKNYREMTLDGVDSIGRIGMKIMEMDKRLSAIWGCN